jgi:putative ABC transport system substrate-binding protein
MLCMVTHILVTRRNAIILLAASCVAFPSLSQTSSRSFRVGFLVPRPLAGHEDRVETFRVAMRELGYVEGKDLTIEWRFADGNYERLPELANQLLRAKVDVLVVDSTPGVKVAQAATTTVPIVMVSVSDPVASGFVASLSRPGGNITGLSNVVADVSPKNVDLLRLAVPRLSRVAVLSNPDNPTHRKITSQVQAAGKTIGLSVISIGARTTAEIEAVFSTIRSERAGALIVLGDPFLGQQGAQIADLALKSRLPTVMSNRRLAERGALMSYGQDLSEHYRRAARYVDKILKGAKPDELPVEQATKIELVINMKTATALGLAIPQALLLRADDVIQ